MRSAFFPTFVGLRIPILPALAALLFLLVAPANSQDINCSFGMSNISFGSIDLSTGKTFAATGTFTYACTGDRREMVRICPSWDYGDVGQLDDGAGHKLQFNLFSDESHSTPWTSWFRKSKGPTIDVPIGRSEKETGSATVYGEISASQQGAPPGTYKATIGGGHVSIDYDSASKGSCDAIKHSQKISRVSFAVTATVRPPAAGSAPPTPEDASLPPTAKLARGMKIEQVSAIFGSGKLLTESVGDSGLKTQVYEYMTSDRRVEITYVDGLVIRYSIISK